MADDQSAGQSAGQTAEPEAPETPEAPAAEPQPEEAPPAPEPDGQPNPEPKAETPEAEDVEALGEPGPRDPGGAAVPTGGPADAGDAPVADGQTEADEVTPPETVEEPPVGETAREDEGKHGVREGDVWTSPLTRESVQVTGVNGDEVTVQRGDGEEAVLNATELQTWRHDGPSHGWGEGSARA